MNEIIQNMIERRSVRSYTGESVPAELIEQVLQAGIYAPSGLNRQDVTLVAVTDRVTRDRLSRMNAAVAGMDHDPFYGAPVVIVVLSDRNLTTLNVEDGALALGNMMNAAHALGLGSCWIHRAKETFKSDEGRALLAEWGLQGDYVGIGNCILGYAADVPEAKERCAGRIVHV